ncbi:MAG TPA: disulfide bond formation protein B [Novimethylophilus sp.]|jgi:disulfide bond formation protein DsbB|uniref:disulfide bond formation protein B n=1 Tax=Novimethylophilus sp. TaxID=2137426 RepID=UPI002F415E1A
MNKLLSGRLGYGLGFLAAFGLVALALYLQVRDHLEPCPLCISQRIAFMALGTTFLIAALHNPSGIWRKVHGALQFAVAAVGAGIALRHIWIQNHADEVMAECGAGFDYIFERFPFKKAMELVFKGTGECSAIDWTLFGLTIPQLSLIAFSALAVYAIILAFVKK